MADLQQLLKLMIESGASDMFLTCGATPRMKVEGNTYPVKGELLKRGEVHELAQALMNERQKAAFDETMEANLSYSFGTAGRFRINVFQQRGEAGMVIRQIKPSVASFRELGLPEQCAGLAMLPRGLVLFVGAAGSGKSTSLAAMINHRAANAGGHILTIEDPIEFLFKHNRALVDQREVSVDTRSFGDALRNAMREAPDVIMIGEIRDQETARYAMSYADTGHLCLSTLHANTADQAMERLLNFFPQQAHKQVLMDLSMNLKAVISQRLIPTLDGKAALATEVLLSTLHVSELIREGRINELKEAMAKGNDSGMHSFDQSLYDLYEAGRISLDEARRNADSRTDLALRIRLSERRTVADAPNLTMAETPQEKGRLHHSRK
ncbi:MAG TPA: PilT/PilU family type 4a pilus ATPase [Nevskia sp.]|nr:PilT/PilU family type 4a pilus ATPase [Nevskia sp.]